MGISSVQVVNASVRPETKGGVPSSNRCDSRGCKSREGLALVCKTCHHQYCMRHRFPTDHKCEEVRRRDLAERKGQRGAAGASALASSSQGPSAAARSAPPPVNCRQEARTTDSNNN